MPFQFVAGVDLSGGCKIYNVKLSYFITFSNIIIPVWTHYIINSLNQDNQSQNKKTIKILLEIMYQSDHIRGWVPNR